MAIDFSLAELVALVVEAFFFGAALSPTVSVSPPYAC
jgi:hypothetical protein